MDQLAPDVSSVAWGHKYFSLLYPDKLDDYHAEAYQRFHLIKLLQQPPAGDGRYRVAGRYVAIARELAMPLNHLTTLLNKRNARPHNYWRVLTNDHQAGGRGQWEAMYAGGYLALGWPQLGDLTNVQDRGDLAVRMKAAYGEAGAMSVELYHFLTHMAEGDLVVAVEQQQVVGIGKITSGYRYEPATAETPHRRQVDWLWAGRQPMAALDAKGRLVGEIKSMLSQVTIEQWLQAPPPPKLAVTPAPHAPTPTIAIAPLRLQGVGGRIQSVLERKRQVILYGPPGTGKT